MLAAAFPALPLPRNGDVLIQPLWVEDLVTCLQWSLSLPETVNQVYDIGGAEYFPYRHALETIMDVSGNRRFLFSLNLPTLKNLTITLESLLPGYPFSSFWVDYLSYNRTCSVDSIPRLFGFLPARFTYRLEHLRGINWKALARQTLFQRPQKK
jgi:NADH dehydrogenase